MDPKGVPGAVACVALGLLLMLLSHAVLAQGVHRVVGADGRVTYSDQPPARDASVRPTGAALGASVGGDTGTAQLPFELRQVARRYPVTLVTGEQCAPCNSGRNLLNARGIPYAEKTVVSFEDSQALKRLSGESGLPFLTIGGQQIKGYSDAEWTQYLDAAGYPKQSALPASYRRPASTPLAAVKAAAPPAPAPAPSPAPTRARKVPVAPPVTDPSGIRF